MKSTFKNPDLHLHSTFSDGTDTPKELLLNVIKAGVDVFALTDHDSYLGCDEMKKYLTDDSPYFIGGVELSCRDNGDKYHILGYCYNVNKQSIRDAVEFTHNSRLAKMKGRLEYIKEKYGYTLTEDEQAEIFSHHNPGKPHAVPYLVKHGYAKTTKEAFALLDEYKAPTQYITTDDAIDAILRANGIPVLAHGILGGGDENHTEEEITACVAKLKKAGLMGLECYYPVFTEEQKSIMLRLADEYNLLITAGSDYHGTKKAVKIGDTSSPDPTKMARFYNTVKFLLEDN